MAADYYELLQITPEASTEEIHKAYRELAMRYHPDRNPTPDAAAQMAAIRHTPYWASRRSGADTIRSGPTAGP